jgi:type I restriction enzyme S subunit
MKLRVKLGELCHVVTKGTTPTSVGLSFTDSGVPFLRIQNLSNKSVQLENVLYVSEETHQALKRSVIKPKDFLITIAGTIGKVAIVPDDFPECNCNQAVAILRFDYKKLNPQYLLHWLDTSDALGQITGRKVTATISNLSLGQIKQLDIPLPPLAEQQKIAAILDTADSLRQKDRQLIDHYTTLSQSLFLEMFGDLKGSVVSLSSLCYLNPVKSEISNLDMSTEVSFVPMARVSEEGKVDLSEVKTLAEAWTGFTYFCENDVVFAKITPCMENGKGGIMRGLKNGIGFGTTEFHVLRPIEDISISEWLYHLINQKYFRKLAENNMTGSAGQKRVPKNFLAKYKVVAPSIALQNQFAERIKLIESQKQQAQASLEKSEALFNSLLQRAFSGELTEHLAA